ncbi:MAG: hypothetical protein KKF67_02005 [Nanoarchaeota archaeon]|nr:hypothetical protein [Nanoarchaeota archaeon]
MNEKNFQKLVSRVKKKTYGIKTSLIEDIIVNTCLPLNFVEILLKKKKASIRELWELNVLGYKRMLEIKQKHNGLPYKIKREYLSHPLSHPCGITKFSASIVRDYNHLS